MTDFYNFTGFNYNLLNEYNNNKQQPQQQQVYFNLSIAYKACTRNLVKAIRGGNTREVVQYVTVFRLILAKRVKH